MSEELLRLQAVKNITGLGRSSIYQYMADGKFPKSVKIGVRAIAWKKSTVQSWIDSRI